MAPLSRIDRRAFLVSAAGALAFAACSGDDSGEPDSTAGDQGDGPFLTLGFPDGLRTDVAFVAGIEQRFPLALTGVSGAVLSDSAPASIDIAVSLDGNSVGTFQIPSRTDGVATAIYPLRFTPEVPGIYEFAYRDQTPRQIMIATADEVPLVQPGDQMRPVDTPTFDDALGVTPLCTLRPDPCPFHDMTLAQALENPGPTVLLVATPAFCQTAICGPVLEMLVDAADAASNATIVHAEVYVDPENNQGQGATFGQTTPVIETYGLSYEPMLAVADSDGRLVERLDFAWDRSELAAALDAIS